jgi:hypothetical protein
MFENLQLSSLKASPMAKTISKSQIIDIVFLLICAPILTIHLYFNIFNINTFDFFREKPLKKV